MNSKDFEREVLNHESVKPLREKADKLAKAYMSDESDENFEAYREAYFFFDAAVEKRCEELGY